MDIIIDTKGQDDLKEKTKLVESDDDLDYDGIGKFIKRKKIIGYVYHMFLL